MQIAFLDGREGGGVLYGLVQIRLQNGIHFHTGHYINGSLFSPCYHIDESICSHIQYIYIIRMINSSNIRFLGRNLYYVAANFNTFLHDPQSLYSFAFGIYVYGTQVQTWIHILYQVQCVDGSTCRVNRGTPDPSTNF